VWLLNCGVKGGGPYIPLELMASTDTWNSRNSITDVFYSFINIKPTEMSTGKC